MTIREIVFCACRESGFSDYRIADAFGCADKRNLTYGGVCESMSQFPDADVERLKDEIKLLLKGLPAKDGKWLGDVLSKAVAQNRKN